MQRIFINRRKILASFIKFQIHNISEKFNNSLEEPGKTSLINLSYYPKSLIC